MSNRWLQGLAGACLSAVLAVSPLCGMSSLAAETEALDAPYDYQITFYAGNQGTFSADPDILVLDSDNVRKEAQVEAGTDAVVVRGLEAGDRVVFDSIQGDAVNLETGSPYYVRGLRKSGGDNDDEKPSAFLVERDQDYVVAYGVRGEQVSYVIRYQDSSGQRLADDRTYYGNVGDQPVIAFRYIEGYEPQAYNLTKTLSKNEAENVFTFVYSRVRSGSTSSSGGASGGSTSEDTVGGGGTAGTETNTNTGIGINGGTVGGTAGVQTAGGGAADAGDTGGEVTGEGVLGVEAPDEEVPADEGPRDLIDLDDEELPLADAPAVPEAAKAGAMYSLPVLAAVSLLLAAVLLILYAGHRYRLIHKRRDDEEEDE